MTEPLGTDRLKATSTRGSSPASTISASARGSARPSTSGTSTTAPRPRSASSGFNVLENASSTTTPTLAASANPSGRVPRTRAISGLGGVRGCVARVRHDQPSSSGVVVVVVVVEVGAASTPTTMTIVDPGSTLVPPAGS